MADNKPEPGTLAAGRAEWRKRHPKPAGETLFAAGDVAEPSVARGRALYARRRNRSAREALIEAGDHRPDNLDDGA